MSRSQNDGPHKPGPITGEALARLAWLQERPCGCGVVLGPARSGKSALLKLLATAAGRNGALAARVDGQSLDARGLMWELAAEWRIAPTADTNGRRLTQDVRDFIQGATAAGQRLAILLDHADRLEHGAAVALGRLLQDCEDQHGLTFVWTAESPTRGEAAELLLGFTELRIECPAPTAAETADHVRRQWQNAGGLAQEIAELSHGDIRRAERLSRLSELAARADGAPLSSDMLTAVAAELA